MKIDIITPETEVFSGDAVGATFPGVDGSFGVLENHAAMIATLKEGKIKVIDATNQEQFFDVKGGVVEVNNNKVIVLAE